MTNMTNTENSKTTETKITSDDIRALHEPNAGAGYHVCGGTILTGGSGQQAHSYCDRCGAFAYDYTDEELPSGTDPKANRAAWDAGDDTSPEASE